MESAHEQEPLSDNDDAREKDVIDLSTVVPPGSSAAASDILEPQNVTAAANPIAGLTAPDRDLERRLRGLSRRGFAAGGAVAGVVGWRWLVTRDDESGLPWPLRRVLEFDERLAMGLFRPSRLSPQFPRSAARMPRVNGSIGLDANVDPAQWRLHVVGPAARMRGGRLPSTRSRPFPGRR